MKSYTYVARDAAGARREGMLAANSSIEAVDVLRQRQLTPICIHETLAKRTKRKRTRHGRVKAADLGAVCWQLSTMLEGGVAITTALEIVSQDTQNLQLQHILKQAHAQVREGRLLSDGLSGFPEVFNQLAIAIVVAGEASGDMGKALRTLAEHFDSRDRIAKKIRNALAYPVFVLMLIAVIVVGVMTLIVPRFRMIFEQLGGRLPAFTQAFMGLYDAAWRNLPYMVGAVALTTSGIVLLSRTKSGHRFLSRVALGTPLFGKLLSEAFIVVFCRTIATLLEAGVPVLETFEILRGMSRNDVIVSAIGRVKQHVTGGSNVALGMAAAGFFPAMVVKMAQVGEESGSLAAILHKTSDHYERKITATIDAMTRLLEPIMITTIGTIVLLVVIALYLPVFTISNMGG